MAKEVIQVDDEIGYCRLSLLVALSPVILPLVILSLPFFAYHELKRMYGKKRVVTPENGETQAPNS